MQPEERLDELLLDWQEEQARGRTVAVEQLCGQDPALAEQLSSRIAAVQQVQRLAAWLHLPDTAQVETIGSTTAPGPQPAAESEAGTVMSPGCNVAGYTVERLLGRGGMGEVYAGIDRVLNRPVAIKVMKPGIAEDAQARQRFLREARAAAALAHDHIVTIHAAGEDGGRLYLVMPLLRGESLQARLRREGRLPVAEALRITREAARGLAAAHRAGLIHRDVKPGNLWLEEDGRVKVLDFGLAKPEQADGLSRTGAFCGTPGYAAPEQIDGAAPAPAADLFSLGCVLYRLLTGTEAFAGATPTALLVAVARCAPESPAVHDPELPGAVCDLTLRLLSREAKGRPASADELIREISELERPSSSAATLPARAVAEPPPLSGKGRRRAWLALAGLAAVLMLGLAGWLIALALWPKTPEPMTPPTQSQALGPLEGDIDVKIYKAEDVRADENTPGQRMSIPGVVPLRVGDWIRIEVEMTRPAYVYVIWLEASGKAVPVFPWKDRQWGNRPAEEPHKVVTLPQRERTARAPLGRGPSGVETILLLTRDVPLPAGAEAELQEVFKKGWKPTGLKGSAALATWLENGEVVKEDKRGAIVDEEAQEFFDPVMQAQRQLHRDLKPWFPYSRAVCYSFKGD